MITALYQKGRERHRVEVLPHKNGVEAGLDLAGDYCYPVRFLEGPDEGRERFVKGDYLYEFTE